VKTGANDPCPCGSGRKYKKCCLLRELQAGPKAPSGSVTEPRATPPAAPAVAIPGNPAHAGLNLSPYTIAKIATDPRSAGKDGRLRGLIERRLREDWTIAKVAGMTTGDIEARLLGYGVRHSRERFLRLAEGRTSAWSISEVWSTSDPVSCRGKEEDFLGLAACELWKRYLPDRPSMEMIDDWMQEGYAMQEEERPAEACGVWWKVWCALLPRLTPAMSTMGATETVFTGLQSVFNWSQDFEMELGNASVREPALAGIGRRYCQEWITQFPGEGALLQVNFRRALAVFHSRLGETAQAEAALKEAVTRWPGEFWGWMALADGYSHFFPGECELDYDPGKAIACIEQALRIPGTGAADRREAEDRLAEIRRRDATP